MNQKQRRIYVECDYDVWEEILMIAKRELGKGKVNAIDLEPQLKELGE